MSSFLGQIAASIKPETTEENILRNNLKYLAYFTVNHVDMCAAICNFTVEEEKQIKAF